VGTKFAKNLAVFWRMYSLLLLGNSADLFETLFRHWFTYRFFCSVFCGNGFAYGWSPVQGALSNYLQRDLSTRIREDSELHWYIAQGRRVRTGCVEKQVDGYTCTDTKCNICLISHSRRLMIFENALAVPRIKWILRVSDILHDTWLTLRFNPLTPND
jgi:hypothetical protein